MGGRLQLLDEEETRIMKITNFYISSNAGGYEVY